MPSNTQPGMSSICTAHSVSYGQSILMVMQFLAWGWLSEQQG